MISSTPLCWTHNISFCTPWSGSFVAHGIANPFRATSWSESHVIMPVPFIHPRTFLVMFRFIFHLYNFPRIWNHILIQFHIINIRIAPIHIRLSVIINKYGRVNVIPMLLLPNQRFVQWVFKRTVRRVGDQYANTITMNRAIHIKFAITFDDLFCPGTVITFHPIKTLQRSDRSMIGPIHHIGGSIK